MQFNKIMLFNYSKIKKSFNYKLNIQFHVSLVIISPHLVTYKYFDKYMKNKKKNSTRWINLIEF